MNSRLALLILMLSANSTLAHAAPPKTNVQKSLVRNWGIDATEAPQAWTIKNASASQEVIVAIIDTGVDVNHPQLRNHLWTNPGEIGFDREGRSKSTNQIDDDRNGFVDDVHGWNFVGASPDLTDRHGHGTHIAGIIDSVANGNSTPKIRIMSLKYFDPTYGEDKAITNTVHAIEYAVKMGARVINYSAGGLHANPIEKAAIAAARESGVIFVAAAGNESSNSDFAHYYPADYNLPNILSVTAVDQLQNILPTSNYGTTSVHIAAPGEDILSTLPQGKYGFMTGTSQATAFASAVAALVISHSPELRDDPERVIEHIKTSGNIRLSLRGKTEHQTELSAYRALAIRGPGESANGLRPVNVATIDERIFAAEFDNDFPLPQP
jgi:thermitase